MNLPSQTMQRRHRQSSNKPQIPTQKTAREKALLKMRMRYDDREEQSIPLLRKLLMKRLV
jgi:hypothetical protein